MERKEVNCRIYQLTQSVLDGRALELTMRSMVEAEKNIWRMDYALLREEIKASYFYAPELSAALMNSIQGRDAVSEEVRCEMLAGLVMRNPHWSIVEEEFLGLYGALQIDATLLFEDYSTMRFLHQFQHRGTDRPIPLTECLESIKALETKRILTFYRPRAWKDLLLAHREIRVEKCRIQRIQQVMMKESLIVPDWIAQVIKEPCSTQGDVVNRWRVKMDKLQRRERIGVSNAEIRKAKIGDQLSHRHLGPMQVMDICQDAESETIVMQGGLRNYTFRYKKKR